MYENELYHFGVKGMKWGVRRQKRFEKKQLKERNKSKQYVDNHLRYNNQKYVDKSTREWKDYYNYTIKNKKEKDEINEAKDRYIMALADQATVSKYFEKPVSNINIDKMRYKEVKNLVDQYLTDYVNASLEKQEEIRKYL